MRKHLLAYSTHYQGLVCWINAVKVKVVSACCPAYLQPLGAELQRAVQLAGEVELVQAQRLQLHLTHVLLLVRLPP